MLMVTICRVGRAAEHVDGDHVVGIDAAALFRSR